MKNNKLLIFLSAIVMIVCIAFLSVMSLSLASKREHSFQFSGLSFGGKAKLRNTIEIPLSAIDSLEVKYGSKNLHVFTGEDNKIVIKEYLVNDSTDAIATDEISNRTAIITGSRVSSFIIFGFNMEERIEIYIPENGLKNLMLTTGSGNISVQSGYQSNYDDSLMVCAGSGNIKWSNCNAVEANFSAGSGNLKLEDVTGDIVLGMGSGNITADNIEGVFTASVGSGNITATNVSGQGNFETSSGNVKLQITDNITGDILLKTGSGNAKLELPETVSGQFDLKTGSGNIDTSFDNNLSFSKNGKSASGNVGSNPANHITVSTGSGNIKVNTF